LNQKYIYEKPKSNEDFEKLVFSDVIQN